jgi:hypothetical protein
MINTPSSLSYEQEIPRNGCDELGLGVTLVTGPLYDEQRRPYYSNPSVIRFLRSA